jgi:hypothetical protein
LINNHDETQRYRRNLLDAFNEPNINRGRRAKIYHIVIMEITLSGIRIASRLNVQLTNEAKAEEVVHNHGKHKKICTTKKIRLIKIIVN